MADGDSTVGTVGTPEPSLGPDDRTCERCGHQFQTRRQRVEHEQRGDRGQRVTCPCGDVCAEGVDVDV